MRLHSVRLSAFRRFRDTAELDGLEPGLNIFAGPNEAGKSTYAAAIRAAFLERYKTRAVADFAPWDVSGARPTVELAFEHDGHEYALSKSFLSRPRCELLIDGGARRLEGEEAEEALAELLGFGFPAKGQSRAEHAGLPGLLWIAQGEGQELLSVARHADSQVREALTQLTGELAAGDSDRLFGLVAVERAELFDARGGKPKGRYRDAEDACEQASRLCEDLAREHAALDADVDRLARLREEDERARREAPWSALEQKAAQARARLAELQREREELDRLRQAHRQADDTLALLHEQLARDEKDRQDLGRRQASEHAAREAAEQAAAHAEAARHLVETQTARVKRCRAQLALAESQAERQDIEAQIQRQQEERIRLEASLSQAQALAERVAAQEAESLRDRADPQALPRLREVERDLAALFAQQRAVATRLRYQLAPDVAAQLDGQVLAREGEQLLTSPARLDVPGVGTFLIEPGGADLADLQARIAERNTLRGQLLSRLDAPDLAAAETRAREVANRAASLDAARRELAIHAPRGLDALRHEQSQAAQRLAQLQARLQASLAASRENPITDMPGLPQDLDRASATQALHLAEEALAQARQAHEQARRAWDGQQAQAHLLAEQVRALQAELADPAREAERQARAVRAAEARAARDDLQARVEQARMHLDSQQPELVEQDARRYERSAQLERQAHQARQSELLQLQGRLQQAGAQGLGERLAQARADLERLVRRRDDIARHAAALDLLWRMLAEQRDAATQRLLAPLSRRLAHYLPLVLPEASLQWDDNLLPSSLRRDEREQALSLLSFGTREQLGVLARLAYADLLREAGRPALLILDDTLVHADAERRDRMKRALFDAASRHQILLFTCHPESWADMGTAVRDLHNHP